jgi:hypothetical protein
VASQTIALALIRQLCRAGALDASDIEAIAETLEADGHSDEAHLVRCEMLNAMAPTQSEWDAERRRSRMQIVPPDGGN